jgi:threonine synthase
MARAVPAYISTRNPELRVGFREALLTGLAPDGGLFIPESIPSIPPSTWQEGASIAAIGRRVLPYWMGEAVPQDVLASIVDDALNFPVPLVPLKEGSWEGVHVLELFHGPTLSFKDFGARTMARLMSYFLKEQDGEPLTILVATSGDTGSAVADGFAGQENIRVVLLYPKGQVSPLQERQLIVRRPGVQALAVQGTFDDCQRLVKQAFMDRELDHLPLSSANSINIGRLLPQMLYYMWGFHQCGAGQAVFCTPSGNLGNLTGGMLAALSGLPVARFIAAHNANDFFPRHLTEGLTGFPPSVRTLSNAMDVGTPSNFERLLTLLEGTELRSLIWGASITDAETTASIGRVFEETGYVADPHTAVGLEAASRYRDAFGTDLPVIVLSTAHPAKFPETVQAATGRPPEAPENLTALWQSEVSVEEIAPTLNALKEHLLAGERV